MCERTRTTQAAGRGARLLDRAIGYALTAVQGVTPDMLGRRTPCASWDLAMLVLHLGESLAALHEGLDAGRVEREPRPEGPPDDPVSALRLRMVDPCGIRLDKLLARQLGVGRGRLKAWTRSGCLHLEGGAGALRRCVRDGQVMTLSAKVSR